MHLTVWVTRERLSALTQASVGDGAAGQAHNAQNERLERLASVLDQADPKPGGANRSEPATASRLIPKPPEARRSPSASDARAASANLPTVQCTWLGPWTFFGLSRSDARSRRFLRDLMLAAAGQTGTPTQLEIATGQLAAEVGEAQALAALQAFVRKRLQETQAQVMLVESTIVKGPHWFAAQRPEHSPWPLYDSGAARAVPVIELPDLAQLMGDSTAKQACWQRLQAIQAAIQAGSSGS